MPDSPHLYIALKISNMADSMTSSELDVTNEAFDSVVSG